MTTSLRLLQDHRLPPAKCKVADSHAGDDGQAEPGVVGHEDKHEEVAEEELDDMDQGLEEVELAPHVGLQGLDPLFDLGWRLRGFGWKKRE